MTRFHAVLQEGLAVWTAKGRSARIGPRLGVGERGEVYQLSIGGRPFALKWYHQDCIARDPGLRGRLESAIRRVAPTDEFLWPLDLVDIPGRGGFGCVMELRGKSYRSLDEVIAAPRPGSALSLAERGLVCLELADAFVHLHARAFRLHEIDPADIFLDTRTMRILIAGADKLSGDIAPARLRDPGELALHDLDRRAPIADRRVDLVSMTALFLRILLGARLPRGSGAAPHFAIDPGRGPIDGSYQTAMRWRSLTQPLRDLFVESLRDAPREALARAPALEWRASLQALTDADFICPACGHEHAADWRGEALTGPCTCAACEAPCAPPDALRIGRRMFGLTPGRRIAPEALGVMAGGAVVEGDAAQPREAGALRNLGARLWGATLANGQSFLVAPGESTPLSPGLRIDFGARSGLVCPARVGALA